MSRCDKAIALLSGDSGGVIKPIASRDEKVAKREREREKQRYEGGIFRARLPEG